MAGPQRAATERNALPSVGAKFYREGDETLFVFVIDTANIVGPRPATRADQEKHPAAWEAYRVAEGVSALDRDASGEDGGSFTAESASVTVPTPEDKPKRKYTRKKG